MPSSSRAQPCVSIVVIGYNDADHLPAALQSARDQTLRDIEIIVVDDASTDATPTVIAEFAARDSRVRSVRLLSNSGGCSGPRNAGLEQARGDSVVFLDSDDLLPRRAVERLHTAAVRTGADVSCGRMVRRHHHPRRHLTANDDLYRRADVLDGVLARPAQLRDTPACGKLFRREFLETNGLRFPEGLLFEDLLFTTSAYAAARRIAIVPALSYVWNVRREQTVPSITNRRELRNWRDRFEIHRRIDADLAGRPRAEELQAAKDRKFLTVDWPIYLRDLRAFPADARAQLVDLAADYVGSTDLLERADVAPGARAACFLAGRRDTDATLTAADFVTTGGVGTDLVVEQDRLYWTRRHLEEPGARAALDVTATGIQCAGFSTTPFLAVVREARVRSSTLALSGHVHDVLGRLDDRVSATLQLSGRFGGRLLDVSVSTLPAHDVLSFSADVDLRRLARRVHPGIGPEVRLDLMLRSADAVARVRLTGRDADLPLEPISLPNRWAPVLGRSAVLQERNGRLVIYLPELHPVADGMLDLATRGRNLAGRFLSRR
jgi:CDP-glycerol glycerophosphotransferase